MEAILSVGCSFAKLTQPPHSSFSSSLHATHLHYFPSLSLAHGRKTLNIVAADHGSYAAPIESTAEMQTVVNKRVHDQVLEPKVENGDPQSFLSRGVDSTPDIEWDDLGFGIRDTDQMYVMKCDGDGNWYKGELLPFGNLELSPSAGVLNYGQGVFEGLKAYRTEDGRILLFRPEENALRMIAGADRMCMPALPVDLFIQAVKQTVLANKRWVPPPGKGSLYIRPLFLGSGPVLGLAPAPEYIFTIYVSPVGNYFKEGLSPIHLKVANGYHRATPGGTGGVKTIGNYASVLKAQLAAKEEGFSDVLYLDAVEKRFLEEVSSCNIFVVKEDEIATPEIKGTILPGITRKSVVELARSRGYKVVERPINVDELLHADEVFCTGTAVVISPVGSITYQEKRILYTNQGLGKISQEIYEVLTGIQTGKAEDTMGWTMEI